MASIDNRIVNMEFNNAEFERRISETMKSLAGLDKAIAETGKTGNGLQDIAKSASSFHMEGVTSAIEGVSAKFLALSTIGITALANITNAAVDAGLRMAKALTIENIGAGFAEYELKMGSIQTIMAGSGADLETVNRKLQELNAYSDRTIYSFADMTQNIGKFTNAGVDLDTSVASIQGVANVAAVSGANAEEASRAMYNFAQALSKGYVQLVDWKSIELANMGTTEFKDQLLQAGVATGSLTKRGEEYVTQNGTVVTATKNFNDSLQDQWLTTEALNKTLGDYADETTAIGKKAFASAQDIKTFSQLMDTTKESIGSGWATTFETIIGNFEESKGLWGYIGESISGIVGRSADARNQMLQSWKDMGGRVELLLGFKAGFEAFFAILKPIREAFRDIFPAMTADRLFELTQKFHAFMEALRPSEKTVDNLRRIFTGLFNVIHVGIEVFKFIAGAIKDFIVELTGAGQGKALSFLAGIGDVLANINAEKVVAGLEATFGKLIELLKWPIPYIEQFVSKIEEFFNKLDIDLPDAGPISGFLDKIKTAFGDLGGTLSGVFDKLDFSGVGNFASSLINGLGEAAGAVAGTIGDLFSGVVDAIAGIFSSGGEVESAVKEKSEGINWVAVLGGTGAALVGGLIVTINRLISDGVNIDFTGGVLTSISGTFDGLTKTLKTMQQDIKSNILIKIAVAIGILAGAMIALSFIDAANLVKSSVAIGVAFGELAAAMKILEKIEFSASTAAKFALMALSFAAIGASMIMLAGAAKIFATMSWEDLAKGGAAFTAVVGAIILMSNLIENEASGMIKASIAMILMAISMDAMYGAIKKFASMDTGDLVQGFIGVAAAMGLLVATMKLMPEDMKEKTTGVLGFSIALNILVFAIKQLGQMDLGELVQGGIAFAGMLGVLVLALNKMPENMAAKSGQLLALAVSIGVMAVALKILATMSLGDSLQALTTLGIGVGILVVALNMAQGGLAGAAALLIISVALLALSVAIKAFAAIGLLEFAKGMLLVAVAIGVLAGVAVLLSEAIPFMMALGVALALIGLGFGAIGFGAAQVAKALAILAGIEDVGNVIFDALEGVGKALPALFIGVAEGIGAFIEVLSGFVPQMVEFGIKMIVALLDGLIETMPKILEFIGVLIDGIIDLIIELVPDIVTAGIEILLGILQGVRETLPEIVTVVGEIITGFLDALAEQLPQIVESMIGLFSATLTAVAEGLGELMPTLMFGLGIAFMTGFFDGISSVASQLWELVKSIGTTIIDTIKGVFGINSPSTVMKDIGIDLIMGFLNGIVETAQLVWDFFSTVAGEVLKWIGNLTRTLFQKGWDLIVGLKNGIDGIIGTVTTFFTGLAGAVLGWIGDTLSSLYDKGWDLIKGLWNGITGIWDSLVEPFLSGLLEDIKGFFDDPLGTLKQIGKDLIQGFWNGIKEIWGKVTSWISDAASHLPGFIKGPLNIDSPSKVFMKIGMQTAEGLVVGMEKMTRPIEQATEGMAFAIMNSFNLDELDMSPVIRPIVDLTNVRAGAATIGGILGSNSYLSASGIASTQRYTEDSIVGAGPTEIKFEQTINAPTQLSTADIYRQTRNQITMAKEELSIA